jgi:hypothetical protein
MIGSITMQLMAAVREHLRRVIDANRPGTASPPAEEAVRDSGRLARTTDAAPAARIARGLAGADPGAGLSLFDEGQVRVLPEHLRLLGSGTGCRRDQDIGHARYRQRSYAAQAGPAKKASPAKTRLDVFGRDLGMLMFHDPASASLLDLSIKHPWFNECQASCI